MDEGRDNKPNMRALFRNQAERAYIFGKVEKLGHAVILLTSKSPQPHPVSERLEICVLDSVREGSAGASQTDQTVLISLVLEIISLLRLASTAGIISQGNIDILVGEYTAVLSRLSLPAVQGIMLDPEDFRDGKDGLLPDEIRRLPSPIEQLFLEERGARSPEVRGQRTGRQTEERAVKDEKKSAPRRLASGTEAPSMRSQRIVDIVTAKGEVSIRDVAAVITDCSEKTIQRELLALVERGVLRKEGERRWSTYRLA